MTENTNDHDLLISMKAEFSTKLDRVISDVRELKDNVADRVSSLENEKVNVADFEKLEQKVQAFQDYKERTEAFMDNMKGKYAILGVLAMALVAFLSAYISKHL